MTYFVARLVVCSLGLGVACGDGGGDMNPPIESVSDGTVLSANITMSAEAGSGVKGLPASVVTDGWSLEYTKFLVTIGAFEFTRADGSVVRQEKDIVVDLASLDSKVNFGVVEVAPGMTEVGFSMPAATSSFNKLAPVLQADVEAMAEGGYSIYVEGSIRRDDGYSCSSGNPQLCVKQPVVAFRWGVATGLKFEGCPAIDAIENGEVGRTLRLSGDRWLRTNFINVVGATGELRAQWIADADRDHDGEVTTAELAATAASRFDRRVYDLRREAPIPVNTALDFFEAQARTIGRDALGTCASISEI